MNTDLIINQFNLKDWKGTVTKVVTLLANDYSRKVDGSLLAMWKMRLANYTPDVIFEAFREFLNSRDDKNKRYMPSSEEFSEFCKAVKALKNKQLQIEYQPNDEKNLTKDQAFKLYETIKTGIGINRTVEVLTGKGREKEVYPFLVYDYCNQEGEIVELRAYGHIDTASFVKQSEKQHMIRPLKVIHCYDQFKNNSKGSDRPSWKSVRCDNHYHATEITIGYP